MVKELIIYGIALLVRNGNLNFYAGFNLDRGNVLHNIRGRVQVNHTLVDSQLKTIPSFGTFTTRSLTGGDLQSLGGNSDGTLDNQAVVLSTFNEYRADYRETNIKC